MLIFDQLNKADRHLRVLSWVCATGIVVLLTGLWWVQVVRSRHFVEDQRTQSYRTVRVPAPRGKIFDRNGVVLAENRPTYNVSLFLEDPRWRRAVQQHYIQARDQARRAGATNRPASALEKVASWFGYEPSLVQLRKLPRAEVTVLERQARYSVTSNIVWQLSVALDQPLTIDEAKFHQHYHQSLALPLPIVSDLNPFQVARLQERALTLPGIEMDIQPTRIYPLGSTAAHVLGYLTRSKESVEDELASYNYPLPYYRGLFGVELSLDEELRGRAGAKSVLVNNLGYRQTETILSPVEAGKNVTLTIDTNIQVVAERALAAAAGATPPVRGAAVVLDVRTGEVIAMASSPTFNPNHWVPFLPQKIWNTYTNEEIGPLQNRAVFGNYMPGSIFKIVVGLAGLEAGTLDPNKIIRVEPNPFDRTHGGYFVGRKLFKDTAAPGDYDFRRAFYRSSNSYFIEHGLLVGPQRIVALGERFHFGERTGIPLQESRGLLPTADYIRRTSRAWSPVAVGNLSIGQGALDVTPLQLAVAVAAVANGGKVLAPQLVLQVASPNELIATQNSFVQPQIRNDLGVSPRSLRIVQQAMLADVEESDGTGKAAHVPGYRVCGKTGTAQVEKDNSFDHYTVWFASYAPFENPHYSVVVMIDHGASGGVSCAPAAGAIYRALKARDERLMTRRESFARN
ncbi:MAG TPA: penicillin-binding transpeptidase domain-containing protein [Candidatus Limnocylindria bacterium]|nr:penicillin-binding transpeptidase domain-containing protein [Candidatus Limnocylindria bacterium]